MPLIVEDGTGVPNANSYSSLDELSEYWAARPHREESEIWEAADEEEQIGAALEAVSYMESIWGYDYIGYPASVGQTLGFPRIYGLDENGDPIPLKDGLGRPLSFPKSILTKVQAELSVRALAEPLSADLERGGRVKQESFKVGPISETVTYADDAQAGTSYGSTLLMISPLLRSVIPGSDATWYWL